jgi:transposase
MSRQRKRYSADFKAKVALEAIRGELTIAQLVSKHGVRQTLVVSTEVVEIRTW